MMTVASKIADWLARQGVTENFSVTGGGAMFLNQAFGNHPAIHTTYMHHEQACAMAAEGYARIAGKPAVIVLTTGPGAINALNGVFGAYTDSIPMIVLSGQVKRETCQDFQNVPGLRQLGDQEGPTVELAKSVCKFAASVRTPEEIQTLLPQAWRLAVSGRPGPVWLDIPLDIQSSTESVTIPPPADVEAKAGPDADKLGLLVERLRAAERPLILAGTGVRLAGAGGSLLEFAERHGIPVATAWTHDLIASDHPLFAGRPGSIGTRAGNFTLQAADLVLVIGSRLNIRQTTYNWDSFAKSAYIVQVDIDPAEFSKPGVRPHLAITADALTFLDALSAQLPDRSLTDLSAWTHWVREIGARYAARNEHPVISDAPLDPYAAVAAVFDHLGENDVVACGNASACILPFQVGHMKAGQRLFSNSGSASMGYDLPAALGAARAIAGNEAKVICFAGDGSLQMNIQELQTLAATQANVTVVVINNSGYASIWQTHENFFGKIVGATPESGVTFPDFVAVAKAYGVPASRISTATGLAELPTLLAGAGPRLIDLQVNPRQEFAPRIKSRIDENGKFSTPELDDMYPFLPQEELSAVRASIPGRKRSRP